MQLNAVMSQKLKYETVYWYIIFFMCLPLYCVGQDKIVLKPLAPEQLSKEWEQILTVLKDCQCLEYMEIDEYDKQLTKKIAEQRKGQNPEEEVFYMDYSPINKKIYFHDSKFVDGMLINNDLILSVSIEYEGNKVAERSTARAIYKRISSARTSKLSDNCLKCLTGVSQLSEFQQTWNALDNGWKNLIGVEILGGKIPEKLSREDSTKLAEEYNLSIGPKYKIKDFSGLKLLPNILQLDCEEVKSLKSLKGIEFAKDLNTLDISSTGVPCQEIKKMSSEQLPNLQTLVCFYIDLTDPECARSSVFSRLNNLRALGCTVNEFYYIRRLSHLHTLILKGVDIPNKVENKLERHFESRKNQSGGGLIIKD